MNSYARQQALELKAEIMHDGKTITMDNNEKRYSYGLKFTKMNAADKQQLAYLLVFIST